MQLRRYWAVVRRRWMVVAAVVGLVAVVGGLVLVFGPRQYTAEVRLLLNRMPNQPPGATSAFRYDDYYRFLSTEYVLDDLVEEVQGNIFARKVLERLQARGSTGLSDEQVQKALKSDRAHRVLTVQAVASSRDMALALAQSVEDVLVNDPRTTQPPDGSRIDVATIQRDPVARSDLARSLLTYALQVVLALLLGIGLAFLLDYLDDRVRDADDARALGLPLLGRLPITAARAR